jgi:hypothetical protein
MQVAAVIGLLLCFGVSTQSASARAADLFSGYQGCLAVAANQRLSEDEPLVILAADLLPREARVVGAVRAPAAGSDCWNAFRGEQPPMIAALSVPQSWREGAFFGVRSQGDLLVVGGPAVRLSAEETERWVRAVSTSLSGPWRAPDVLGQAYRYGVSDSQAEAVELYIGRAEWNPGGASTPIKSLTIRRFFLIDGQLLASEQYERVSGVEERVDTEAPALTVENWCTSDTERTVGFFSEDQGRSWTRLSTDVGFEGIWWIAQALQSGLPRTFERYLYTVH